MEADKSLTRKQKESNKLYQLFGDEPACPMERSFSIQRIRATHPNMYLKLEWAKKVIAIYRRALEAGEVDGIKRPGFVYPYPQHPREKWAGGSEASQRASRTRGGKTAAIVKRARRSRRVLVKTKNYKARAPSGISRLRRRIRREPQK